MKYQRTVRIIVPFWVRLLLRMTTFYYCIRYPHSWRAMPWPRWASSRMYCIHGPITAAGDE